MWDRKRAGGISAHDSGCRSTILDMKTMCGDAAIPFELHDAAGEIQTLGDYSGRWLLLVFHRHLG